jgi:threonine dehydratase
MTVTYDDVVAAHERIAGIAHRTPVVTSTTLNEMVGAEVFFKAENFQRMGAFKFRGAYNAIFRLSDEQKAAGVIAYSSGNHAQAIALAANLLGASSVIVMPKDAPAVKVTATKEYGAEVVLYDRYSESREEIGRKLAEERGATLIPPFDHLDVIAGQGTAVKELFEDAGSMDIIVSPLGGGGLLAGSVLAAKALNPDCMVYGVEPEAGNDGQQSFRSGELVTIATPRTIADGAQTLRLGDHTFEIIKQHVQDIVTVTDEEVVEAMRFFAGRMKLVVEPTGALAMAAVMTGKIDISGKRVGVLISGGNMDLNRYAALLRDHEGDATE